MGGLLSGPMPGADGQEDWTFAPYPSGDWGQERCVWCEGEHTADHDPATKRCLVNPTQGGE